jgi:DNA adenine methylase
MALKRLSRVQIECKSWEELIPRLDHKEALFYVDPPYEANTRIDGGYNHEMDVDAHKALIALLLKLKGMVVLSGYETPVYHPLDKAGWVRQNLEGVSFSSDKRTSRTEVLWLSPKVAEHVQGIAARQMSFMELV